MIAGLKYVPLARQLVLRDVLGRYRGATLGVAWSLLTPLFSLAIFTFVFGSIFKAKWTVPDAATLGGATSDPGWGDGSTAEFAIILFIGLIVFGVFVEVVTRAPSLILSNAHFVKKIVFPLTILVPVALGSALVHAGLSLAVLVVFILLKTGSIPLTALWLPIILAPFAVLTLGLGWFLASLGVYFRDIGQLLPSVTNALMFLSPVFFSASAIPARWRPWLFLNPVTLPIEQARQVLYWRIMPDFTTLALYSIIAIGIASLGYVWFEKTRKGFADVI